MTKKEIASYIDHTILSPDASIKQVSLVCSEAKKYGFASVCINPVYVPFAASELSDSDVKVCTVIGFPLGASSTGTKVFETIDAIKNGADEIDMVINITDVKNGAYDAVEDEIREMVNNGKKTHSCGKKTK